MLAFFLNFLYISHLTSPMQGPGQANKKVGGDDCPAYLEFCELSNLVVLKHTGPDQCREAALVHADPPLRSRPLG
jgi:hypothetical protein